MTAAGAVLLAGGRSTRMGAPKAWLDWHGSPLVRRVAGLLLRAVPGPVVLVRAAGQPLPPLPPRVTVVADPEPDLGPLAGLATGLAELAGRGVPVAFACSVDLPLLHPALVGAVLAALAPDAAGPGVAEPPGEQTTQAAAPEVDGRLQPLAAAYRTGLAAVAAGLVAAGDRRATALLQAGRTVRLDRERLLADPALAAADPQLRSLLNLNRPEDYRAALALPLPEVTVLRAGLAVQRAAGRLATLLPGAGAPPEVTLNGLRVPADPELPLLAGDVVVLDPPG